MLSTSQFENIIFQNIADARDMIDEADWNDDFGAMREWNAILDVFYEILFD
jgi:hypothetical protein